MRLSRVGRQLRVISGHDVAEVVLRGKRHRKMRDTVLVLGQTSAGAHGHGNVVCLEVAKKAVDAGQQDDVLARFVGDQLTGFEWVEGE